METVFHSLLSSPCPPTKCFVKYFYVRDASLRFMGLWKKKHETGQWLEIGAMEAIASQPDVSIMNGSGIVFSSIASKQSDSNSEMASEGDGKLSMDGTAGKETNH